MPKTITLKSHLTTGELYKRYRACRKPNEKLRWRALYLISSGIRAAEAARRVGRTSGWATQLTQRYNESGTEVVADQRDAERQSGRTPTLNAQLAVKLDAALHAAAPDGGLWTAKKVADWIERETGRRLHETSAWRVLGSLGFTLQSPRPKHHKSALPEERAAFKKKSQPHGRATASRTSG